MSVLQRPGHLSDEGGRRHKDQRYKMFLETDFETPSWILANPQDAGGSDHTSSINSDKPSGLQVCSGFSSEWGEDHTRHVPGRVAARRKRNTAERE